MKLLNKFLFGTAVIASLATLPACSEEDTLNGADDIYIELAPTDIELQAGDTVRISARVSNVSGHDIATPIVYTTDDESVARVVKMYKWVNESQVKPGDVVVDPATALSRAEGEGEGEGNTDVDNPEEPAEPEQPTGPVKVLIEDGWGITGIQGAQNKSTLLRATLENGMFAVTPVSVVYRSVRNALTPGQTFKRSYQRQANDTCWFNLQPIALIDEFTPSYKIELTESHPGINGKGEVQEIKKGDDVFTFIHENPAENIVIDRELGRIGVVYTAPRICGKATCTMTLTNGEDDVECSQEILIYPKISPGFEVNGVRPLAQEANPSNIKIALMSVSMDINSTYLVGACLGVEGFWDQDICNAYAAEKAGMFKWTVDGSSVIVEDQFADFDYNGGYVAYLKVRSGIQEGLSVITYHMPDTTLVCNLSVENYNIAHPVERIVVSSNGTEVDEVTFTMGQPASLEISVVPDASFEYHVPEVEISDPSILSIEPRDDNSGFSRNFKTLKPGVTYLHIKSLDKEKTVKVTVVDAINRVSISPNSNQSVLIGESINFTASVFMASNTSVPTQNPIAPVEWIVSDPNIATLTVDPANQMKATLTGVAEGEVTVQAVCGDRRSAATTVKVEAMSDIHLGSDVEGGMIYAGPDAGTIELFIGDLLLTFAADYDEATPNYVTSASGTTTVNYGASTYDNCQFTITVAQGADAEHYVVNGTITLPNGMKIFIENVVCEGF